MNGFLIGTHFRGELAALCAALFWALASVVYSRVGRQIPPIGLNLIKGMIAIALLLLTIGLQEWKLPEFEPIAVWLLLLSGVIGIAIGDSAYFATLNCLGARRALLLETLAPPLTAILALIFLKERLAIAAWCGIFLTVLGVAWVVTERATDQTVTATANLRGLAYGLLAEICQASGIILSHIALTQTAISPLWSTLVRLIGGTSMLLLWLPTHRQNLDSLLKPLQSQRVLGVIFLATFLGTYLGIWLQQTALKFTAAGIAQALNSTSPLFVLPIAAGMGERVSFRAILGAMIAIGGVVLLFQSA